MPWLAAAAAAAPIVTGIIGQNQAAGARTNAENDAKAALAAYQNIATPDIEKMRLALEGYQSAGNMTPTMETTSVLGNTNLSNIAQDPRYNQYTMDALQKMAQVSQQGLPEADRAQLQNILNATAQQDSANRKGILENRAARGMGGSGDELAAQLASAQSGANSASNNAMQLAALAAQRKLDATSNLGSMVNTAQNADYQRQAQLNAQKDAIAQFNAQNQQGVTQRNVGAQNQAQAANLQNAQRISDANVNTRNQQQQFNKGLYQTDFANQMEKAKGLAGGYNNMAGVNTANANATGQMYSGIGSGVAGMIGAMGKPSAAPAAGADVNAFGGDWSNTKNATNKYNGMNNS